MERIEMCSRLKEDISLSLPEFCLVIGLEYFGVDIRKKLETLPSKTKTTYFGDSTVITIRDVKDVFLRESSDPNYDFVRLGILYLLTSYPVFAAYNKIVDH